MSNFTEVSRMNEIFGNRKGDPNNPDWNAAIKQINLIREEFIELEDGVNCRDLTEIRDAIADILVVTYGLAHVLGIDADADMKEVQESNLSKLCKDSEELQATMSYYYDELGVEVYSGGEEGAMWIKSAVDQTAGGKFYPKDKFLKNTKWMEPHFE